MRFHLLAPAILAVCTTALAHGPQIQITGDTGKIVTREILPDTPDYASLSDPTRVYVLPLRLYNDVWHTRANHQLTAGGEAEFPSGPGLMYGYDLLDGGPQVFAAGSVLSLQFTQGLTLWDGDSFEDAGATQLKAYRGSNVNIASPADRLAVTSDVPNPSDLLSLNAIAANYGTDGANAHGSIRYAMLGDGSSPLSAVSDGIYMTALQLSSTQIGMEASEPFYFVLYKGVEASAAAAAARSLGFSDAVTQVIVPEPASVVLVGLAFVTLLGARKWR